MATKIERRFLTGIRAESQGDEMALVGYAALFGVKSHNLGGFREILQPRCFADAVSALRGDAFCTCLQNHDANLVLGNTANGTLDLKEDDRGLKFRCILPPTQAGRDAHTLVRDGYMRECSFSFTCADDDQTWQRCEDDDDPSITALRTIRKISTLYDVSVVSRAAYPNTIVGARHLDLFPNGLPDQIARVTTKNVMSAEERAIWRRAIDELME